MDTVTGILVVDAEDGGGRPDTVREFPASFGQRLLWLMSHYRPGQDVLSCPLICRIQGPADSGQLEWALTLLCARHESLRTTFRGRGPRLTQVVHEPAPAALQIRDLAAADDPESALAAELAAELRTPVDGTQRPWRATLWTLSDDDHVLAWTLHHLVADSMSCGVLFRELATLLASGDAAALPLPSWQYPEFSEWQRGRAGTAEWNGHETYWRRHLHGMRVPSVPLGACGAGVPAERQLTEARIPEAVVQALREVARRERATMFASVLAVQAALLYRVCGDRDIAVASLLANRSKPELTGTVGFLANMVVLRVQVPRSATFADLVRRSRGTLVGALVHQEFPFQMLSIDSELPPGRRADDVVLQMLAEPISQIVRAGDLRLEGMVPEDGGRFDLELDLIPQDGGIRVLLFYRPGRVDDEWAARYVAGFVDLAREAAYQPDRPLFSG